MPINNVSTVAPGGFGLEAEKIARARKMAELLQQQSLEPTKGEMVSGYYVPPSWTQGAAKLLQAYGSRKQMEDADTKASELDKRRKDALVEGLTNYQKIMQGTPDQQVESKAKINPDGSPVMETVKGTPGDRNAALIALLRSDVPELSQMGMQGLTAKPDGNFAKVDAKDYTPQSIAKFAASGNYADLVPVRKMDIAPGGQVWNPYDAKPGMVFNDPNKPFALGPNGPVANAPFQQYEMGKARAGATNVSVNTATKPFLGEIGKGVGESVNSAFTGAQSAAQTLNNVNQIRQGLQNAFTGPGAGARVKLAQVGEVLGVTGKDNAEKLQNTRSVIQGLARQELAAAGQMKGQGQVTEFERAILRKAESGDISEFTKPEIETFLGAVEKTARYRIGLHNSNLERLRRDPNASGVVDYMTVNVPEMWKPQSAVNPGQPAQSDWGIKRIP